MEHLPGPCLVQIASLLLRSPRDLFALAGVCRSLRVVLVGEDALWYDAIVKLVEDAFRCDADTASGMPCFPSNSDIAPTVCSLTHQLMFSRSASMPGMWFSLAQRLVNLRCTVFFSESDLLRPLHPVFGHARGEPATSASGAQLMVFGPVYDAGVSVKLIWALSYAADTNEWPANVCEHMERVVPNSSQLRFVDIYLLAKSHGVRVLQPSPGMQSNAIARLIRHAIEAYAAFDGGKNTIRSSKVWDYVSKQVAARILSRFYSSVAH